MADNAIFPRSNLPMCDILMNTVKMVYAVKFKTMEEMKKEKGPDHAVLHGSPFLEEKYGPYEGYAIINPTKASKLSPNVPKDLQVKYATMHEIGHCAHYSGSIPGAPPLKKYASLDVLLKKNRHMRPFGPTLKKVGYNKNIVLSTTTTNTDEFLADWVCYKIFGKQALKDMGRRSSLGLLNLNQFQKLKTPGWLKALGMREGYVSWELAKRGLRIKWGHVKSMMQAAFLWREKI